MTRTRVAALQAAAAALVLVVGSGLFLGFALVPTLVAGAVLAAAAALLLLGAAGRAGTAGTPEGPRAEHDPAGPPRPAPDTTHADTAHADTTEEPDRG